MRGRGERERQRESGVGGGRLRPPCQEGDFCMATTETLRTEFERYMDEHNVKYTVVNEAENVVLLSFSRSEDESTRVFVDFDESDNASSVHFCVQNFAKVKSQDLLPKALLIVNELNMNWRWLKFYIDVNSLEITADSDAKVFPGTVCRKRFYDKNYRK